MDNQNSVKSFVSKRDKHNRDDVGHDVTVVASTVDFFLRYSNLELWRLQEHRPTYSTTAMPRRAKQLRRT